MASTAAVLFVKPRLTGTQKAARSTVVKVDLALRLVSGLFSQSGVQTTTNLRNLKSWLPGARVAVTDPNTGVMTPEWYRFFQFVTEISLGGAAAPTVADVVSAVNTTTDGAIAATQQAQAVSQQADANAQSLAAAVQVVKTAGLAGASQIPPVQLASKQMER